MSRMSELLLSCLLLRECEEVSRWLIPTPLQSSFVLFFSPNLTSKRGQIKSEMLQELIFDWQLVSGFLFFLPLLLFYCLTMAVGVFVVSFLWSKRMEEEEQGRREEVRLSERGWAVQMERWEEEEGAPILFTLAAFGLRMSWFFFFFFIILEGM